MPLPSPMNPKMIYSALPFADVFELITRLLLTTSNASRSVDVRSFTLSLHNLISLYLLLRVQKYMKAGLEMCYNSISGSVVPSENSHMGKLIDFLWC